eukprot:GHVR01084099.1.p1 GENE.GHVR01084099.1~~GHVR01084099.1.p1  ORF type:complete len:459 (+),score=102.42 GHVR01084099.1:83-1459(+)
MAEQISLLQETDPLTKDPKAQEDYSKETSDVIAVANELDKGGRIEEAVEAVLAVEKKARQASDAVSCSKLTCHILSMFKQRGDWNNVEEYLQILCKKRGQLRRSQIDMVRLCSTWVEGIEYSVKLKFIDTLCNVTDGKIFVEVERARVLRILSSIKEGEGDVDTAAKLIQDVQVETFGAMDRREKAEYILEQMRLMIRRSDFVRCQIISKKVNPKLLEAADFQDIKLQYNRHLIVYWLSEGDFMEVAKCYLSMFNTPSIKDESNDWMIILECYALFLLLTASDNEQMDLLNKLQTLESKRLDKLPILKELLSDFLRVELITWPLTHNDSLSTHQVFTANPHEGGAARWDIFRKRVVQHNIRVAAAYYSQINLTRLASLIGLSVEDTELEIGELVTAKSVTARMDRLEGVCTFLLPQTSTAVLCNWSRDVGQVLDLVTESCHLIQKERMVHVARSKIVN